MNPMQAGLPNQVASATGGWRLGDIKAFSPVAKLLFVDEDGTWLRTGVLSTWLSSYSPLLKHYKGLCIRDLPTPVATGNYNVCTGANLYYVSGNYHMVGGGVSGLAKTIRVGATMGFGTDRSGDTKLADLSNIRCSMLMTGGTVCVAGSSAASQTAIAASVGNGIYSGVGGPSGAVSFDFMMANAAGTLGVTWQTGQTAAGANIWTTVNGTSYTQRTGSGGNAGTLNGGDWFPCASAFMFIVGTATLNRTTDGFTQTAVTLPSLGSAAFFTNDTFKTKIAHSPTASLILLNDGRLLRTTDGTNFAIVDITNLEGYGWTAAAISTARMSHDGARFVIHANSSLTGRPMFFYSENDGATFTCSMAYENVPDGAQNDVRCLALQRANGRLFMVSPNPGAGEIGRSFDMTAEIGSAVSPTKVGVMVPLLVSGNGAPYYNKVI